MAIITTNTCTLRPLRVQRDKATLAKFANNPNIARFLRDRFPHPYRERHAIEFINAVNFDSTVEVFAIRQHRTTIGTIGLTYQEDIYRLNAEVGFWVAEEYWGKGLATAAVGAITAYAFQQHQLRRLFASVLQENTASCRVMEKVGYVLALHNRNNILKEGQLHDELVYHIYPEHFVAPEQIEVDLAAT